MGMRGCGDVGMWGCGDVGMWGCGGVGVWGCGDVGMWGCGDVRVVVNNCWLCVRLIYHVAYAIYLYIIVVYYSCIL